MKRFIFLLTFVLSNFAAESELVTPELHYIEKINYINTEQFNQNIQDLLSQPDEANKKITACLIYLSLEISHLKSELYGSISHTNYLDKQVQNIEQILDNIKKIII